MLSSPETTLQELVMGAATGMGLAQPYAPTGGCCEQSGPAYIPVQSLACVVQSLTGCVNRLHSSRGLLPRTLVGLDAALMQLIWGTQPRYKQLAYLAWRIMSEHYCRRLCIQLAPSHGPESQVPAP